MYILSMDNKKTILCAVILILNFWVDSSAQEMKNEKITKGNYTFTIDSSSKVIKQSLFGGKIPCCRRERTQKLKLQDEFRMTIEDKYLTEILAEFGLESDIGINQARLKAMISLRNELAHESRFIAYKGLSSEIVEEVHIKERLCYNQRVFLVFTRKKYKVKTMKERFIVNKAFKFDWEDDEDHHIVIEAEYDETCDSRCQIQGKEDRVMGKNNEEQWAQIPYKGQEVYFVPLYWGSNGKLLEVITLLPEDVRTKVH